jgi:hypothetical protein
MDYMILHNASRGKAVTLHSTLTHAKELTHGPGYRFFYHIPP